MTSPMDPMGLGAEGFTPFTSEKDTFVLHTLLFHMLPVRRILSPWPSLGFCKRQDIRRSEKRELLEPLVHRGSAAEKIFPERPPKRYSGTDWHILHARTGGLTLLATTTTTTTTTDTTDTNSRSFFDRFWAFCWFHTGPSELLYHGSILQKFYHEHPPVAITMYLESQVPYF